MEVYINFKEMPPLDLLGKYNITLDGLKGFTSYDTEGGESPLKDEELMKYADKYSEVAL